MKNQPSAQDIESIFGATPAPYPVEPFRTQLAIIKDLAPSAISLRTDRFKLGPVSEDSPMRIIIELGKQKPFYLSLNQVHGKNPIPHITRQLGVAVPEAERLRDAFQAIADMNAMGAWCVAPSGVKRLDLSRDKLGDRVLDPEGYLAEVCQILADDFPSVGRIDIQTHITEAGGKQRRRSFYRFLSPDGALELAALDGSGFPIHVRAQLNPDPDDEMLPLCDGRMRFWAAQLGTTAELLAETFGTLSFLVSTLHVTRIHLRQ